MDFDIDTMFLDINGLSRHLGVEADLPSNFKYNERNPGAGITIEDVDNGLVKGVSFGGYKNSFSQPSFYLTGNLAKRFGKDYYADLGGFAGLASGYKSNTVEQDGVTHTITRDSDINPLAGLMLNLGKKDVARLGIKYAPGRAHLIMMNLGIPLK